MKKDIVYQILGNNGLVKGHTLYDAFKDYSDFVEKEIESYKEYYHKSMKNNMDLMNDVEHYKSEHLKYEKRRDKIDEFSRLVAEVAKPSWEW